jgi:nicotinamide riboside kinase
LQKKYKIVITGPESSGKTVLAEALAAAVGCAWSPEFARYYVAALGRPYERGDLHAIGRGQRLWEDWYGGRDDRGLYVCDTDWTVLQVWEAFGYGVRHDFTWQQGYGPPRPADLYLLCRPDFPWQPDPLREHPEAREILFRWYEALLQEYRLPYRIVAGSERERLATGLAAIGGLPESERTV